MHPPSPFAGEFRAFALEEARAPMPRDAVLFYGSSSIRFWQTLAQDFPELAVVNRGFGGSTLAECVEEMERLVFPVQPRAVVLYAGENDLDQGASPERGADEFIGPANLGQRPGARWAGFDGNEDERHEPESVVEPAGKFAEQLLDALGRRALVEIVLARIEHHGAGLHRKD
jgi:lysophospholipase L1-like esterase